MPKKDDRPIAMLARKSTNVNCHRRTAKGITELKFIANLRESWHCLHV